MIRCCLADDQTLVRLGLRRLLELSPDVRVVAEAADGEEAVRAVQETRPDVLLLDVRMPRLGGVGVLETLSRARQLPPAIMLTTFSDDEVLLSSFRAGAHGYLLKDVGLEELLSGIRTVAAGGWLPRSAVSAYALDQLRSGFTTERASGMLDPPSLTERELDILRLLPGGYSNRELADILGLREGTVKNHLSSILFKLEARDRTRAVLRALELGLL